VRFRLLPTDDKFFALFDQAAANASECARRLQGIVDNGNTSGHEGIKDCERQGDEITRTILTRLNSTFVTPFDREDIHALAESFDDVVDDIQTVSELMLLTQVSTALPDMREQASLLVQMAEEAEQLVARLESMKEVKPHLDAIDRLESEGDEVYRRIVAHLFGGELEALEVLRLKGIVEALEGALNRIEDISDVIESIVLKHA
jgi:predicted phosphate transport protein (TIGR00153 family)